MVQQPLVVFVAAAVTTTIVVTAYYLWFGVPETRDNRGGET